MQTLAERLVEQQREVQKLLDAYKQKSGYDRLYRGDEQQIVYVAAAEQIIGDASAKVQQGKLAEAHDMLEKLIDSMYEEGSKLPLPFLID